MKKKYILITRKTIKSKNNKESEAIVEVDCKDDRIS